MIAKRYMRYWQCSLDDSNGAAGSLCIHCPDILSAEELRDVKDFVALFLRQLEHWSLAETARLALKENK